MPPDDNWLDECLFSLCFVCYTLIDFKATKIGTVFLFSKRSRTFLVTFLFETGPKVSGKDRIFAGMNKPVENKGCSWWALFWSFFKIGGLTFGGGYAMIPIMQHEIIHNRKWISSDEFIELLALAQTSPGPIAVNTAVFVGYKTRGYRGAVTALLGTVLPAFCIILLIAVFFADFTKYPVVESAFRGMRPAVVALIAAPVYNMLKGMGIFRIMLAVIAAVVVGFLGVSPVWFLLTGAVGGIIYGITRKENENKPDGLT